MSELVPSDTLSGDVIAPLNETTPNLGLNKPTVGGDDDVWGYLLNANADTLDTTITDLRGEVAALVGILLFIGSYDAPADHAYFTGASGFPDGPLPPASVSNFNVYLIVTVGGMGTGNAPAVQLNQGDWLVSDGIQWNRLALGIPPGGDVAAANVTVTPAVQGATDVQTALEQLEANYLPLTGGVLAGALQTLAGNSAAPGLLIGGTDAGFWRLGASVFLNAGSSSPAMQWSAAGIVSYAPITLPADPIVAFGAATKQYVDATPALHNIGRNLLHNPLFNVAQRGAGIWSAPGYTADRWQMSGDTPISVSIAAMSDAIRAQIGDEAAAYNLGNTFTGNAAAGGFTALNQNIEGVRRLAGKTVTVSFWANASAALRLGVAFIQAFGSGGSPSASVPVNGQSVTLSGTWTRYGVTIAIPSVSGKTLGTNAGTDFTALYLIYSAGADNNAWAGNVGVQSGTINLWGIQLEIGTQTTPLEKPDPRYDLANCQRFYQVGSWNFGGGVQPGVGYATSQAFPTTMRASPTLTTSGTTATNTTNQSVTALFASPGAGISIYAQCTAAAAFVWAGSFQASADL
jgi:hypothetical protein